MDELGPNKLYVIVNRCAIHQHAAYELDFGIEGPIVI